MAVHALNLETLTAAYALQSLMNTGLCTHEQVSCRVNPLRAP